MTLLRAMWAASSAPERFFYRLERLDEQLWTSAAVMGLSWFSFALLQGIYLTRLSQSLAFIPVIFATLLLMLITASGLWFVGGTVLQRPSQLELRAYELVAWSWGPAFFIGLSFLPSSLFAPQLGLIVSLLTLFVWHLRTLWLGLKGFEVRHKRLSFSFYLAILTLLPTLLLVISYLMIAGLRR